MRWSGFAVALLFAAAKLTVANELVITSTELRSAFDQAHPTIKLPLPDGTVRMFQFTPGDLLPREFPFQVRYLKGRWLEAPIISANVVLTPTALRAQIFLAEGIYYVNSRIGRSGEVVIGTATDDAQPVEGYQCLSWAGEPMLQSTEVKESDGRPNVLRTFRLAPAATAEFTEFHGSKEAAVLEVVTAISRASGIYHRELGISFQLAAGFEQMVFTDPATDPYSSNDPSEQLIEEAQAAFDEYIGTENYDLGIVLTRGMYGLAYFNSVCDPERKGRSCVGLPEPAGDAFHVNLVTHELGHQFGAKHTFNSPNGFCAERRDGFTAFEPGTGSTIMSYSSLPCDGDSFQARNDTYFHSASIKQILDFVNGGLCAQVAPRENTAPTIDAGPEYSIPARTPFALTATGTDAEGDTIFYCWEERDLGPARNLSAPDDGQGPLFRSFTPTTNPTRIFPRLELVLGGADAPEERLPTLERTMAFRVTARDSHEDGAVNWADTQIQIIDTGAPFRIASHNAEQTVSNVTLVEWDVANTTSAPISAASVRILLSTNAGESFDFVLADATPNDGSEEVALPLVATTAGRIKVEPINNIFFDINDAPLTIVPPLNLAATAGAEGTLHFSWAAEVGMDYVLQRAATLPVSRWLEVLRTNAVDKTVSVTVQMTGTNSFYRVVRP